VKRLLKCSRCRVAWYCGKECQTKHWKSVHREECSDSLGVKCVGNVIVSLPSSIDMIM